MKKIYIVVLLSLLSMAGIAQNEFTMSEQLFSRLNINPAASGNSENINVFNTNRLQWAGFDGAPTSTMLNVHSYIKNMNSGIGGTFSYDELGLAYATVNAKLAYSYHIDLSKNALLALGVSGGIQSKSFDPTRHIMDDISNDPGMYQQAINETNADFDFGAELSTKYLLVGGSVLHLGQFQMTTLRSIQSYYGYVRGKIPVSNEIMVTPSVLYMNSGQTNKIEINATAFYQGKYWFGLGYRTGSALMATLGFEWEWLRVGYSYELGMGQVFNLNDNTHELMLSFVIPTKDKSKKKK
jgi:type IX secretion system PorP/SprF family membrane protein